MSTFGKMTSTIFIYLLFACSAAKTLRGGEEKIQTESSSQPNGIIEIPLWSSQQIQQRRQRLLSEEEGDVGSLEVETVTALDEHSNTTSSSHHHNHGASSHDTTTPESPAVEDEMLIPLYPGLGTHFVDVFLGECQKV
jgi:hypothetical protein